MKENGILVDCFLEEEEKNPYPGQVYKGVIKNIVPAIKGAFVDIGLEKNAFLYMEGKYEKKNIRKNDEVIVEVVKEELGDKGAKITTAFTIPGRYCVIMTDNNFVSFSSKIYDEDFKKYILSNINKPEEIGIKIRTNAQSINVEDINKEIDELYAAYKKITAKAKYSIKPELLYDAGGVLLRTLRDNVDASTKRIVLDSQKDYEKVMEFIEDKADIISEVKYYDGHCSLFDLENIEKQILHLRSSRVNLKCGGYIIIDKTEAMYVIDVNSGKNVSPSQLEKTAFCTNMEAAAEAARQIRLRNLSGIIVIDFVDMHLEENKSKVIEVIRNGFSGDKNKTVIFPFTELGLIQIARRRRGKNISEYIEENCSQCEGKGRKLKFSYICMLIRNEVLKMEAEGINNILISINEYYKMHIEEDKNGFIESINGENKGIYVKYINDMDNFKLKPLIFNNQLEDAEKYQIRG
ncbi:Rne/Rng family ribonuclease [Clostridium sp. 19966]|uniref:Rne/Rng family ribonuclease n=1 Tax=Clostridium sp. 19966 TaxID=2768166 RepID=UPI0028E2703E|nr:Rne/Rng family ribonuclease [Clostridium sp. 19966]